MNVLAIPLDLAMLLAFTLTFGVGGIFGFLLARAMK